MAWSIQEQDKTIEEHNEDAESFSNALKIGKELLPRPDSLEDMSEMLVDLKLDAQAFAKGAAAGALVDGPLPAGEIVGGVGAVALRRGGKELIKKGVDLLPKVDYAKIIDEAFEGTKRVWDDATGWVMRPVNTAQDLATGGMFGTGGPGPGGSGGGLGGGIPNQRNITPNITSSNEKTLKSMGLWEAFREFDIDEFGGKVTRKEAKAIVTPEIPGFTNAQAERLGKLPELRSFYRNLTDEQIIPQLDHKNPLKLSAYLMDKTTGAKRIAIRKAILDEGVYLAEMAENMQALPREVHKLWTDNMNKYLGKTHKNFQDTFLAEMKTLGITDDLDIAREFARRIKAARETFDVAFDAHKITYGSEWTNNIDDMVNKLNEAFEAGDEWAPRRTNEAVSGINESLSNLDEVPFNNEAAQDLIRRFNLDNIDVHTLKELFDKPMAEQVRFLKKHTGKTIGELNDQLQHYNMSIADLLNLLDE